MSLTWEAQLYSVNDLFWENWQTERRILYLVEHLMPLKGAAPFSQPSCFLSDNNLLQVESSWLAAPYHTFGLGKWNWEVCEVFLDYSQVNSWLKWAAANTQVIPAYSKSTELWFSKLTFRDYYDLQMATNSDTIFLFYFFQWNLMVNFWKGGELRQLLW